MRDHAWDVHSACHYCSTTVDDRESLYTHWLDDHEGDLTTEDRKRAETTVGDRTVCPTCDQRFASDSTVRDHSWDAHGACYICGAEFDTQDALFTHQLAIHDDELSHETRDRAEAAVAPLTFGNRLAHQGPVGALTKTSVSRRKLLAGGAVVAVGGVGGVAANSLFGSSARSPSSRSGGTSPGTTATPATFTTIDGEEKQLTDYRGQKVMFWVFATWCPSCKQGAQALQANNDTLQDVTIIALKSFGNAGYDGPSISEFANQYAPQLVDADNWVWGNLSKDSTRVWNPQNKPDLYWLIDTSGTLQTKTAAPAATMDRILQFAQGSAGDRPGKSIEIQPSEHIQPGDSHPEYNSNPPTSGWHYPKPAEWGFYNTKLPDERVVHNLEHGDDHHRLPRERPAAGTVLFAAAPHARYGRRRRVSGRLRRHRLHSGVRGDIRTRDTNSRHARSAVRRDTDRDRCHTMRGLTDLGPHRRYVGYCGFSVRCVGGTVRRIAAGWEMLSSGWHAVPVE